MPPHPPERTPRTTRRGLFGWALFDWATQPFYTLIVTFLFAPYFVSGFMDDPAEGQTVWAFTTGAAQLVAAFLAPVLGAIADAGMPRKPWIAGFSVLLVVGMCGLWFAIPGHAALTPVVLVAFALAILGAELSTVFNNAMMPGLVANKRLGTLSGVGWGTGYAGGLVSLAIVAGLIVTDPNTGKTLFGLQPILSLDTATREGDRLVGPFSAIWYVLFVLPLFFFTPDQPSGPRVPNPILTGLHRLVQSIKDIVRDHGNIALFLLARMLYADGLAAVFAFGGIYAASVFGWGAAELGLFGIILTVAALVGVLIGGTLDDRVGSKPVIVTALMIFSAASIGVLSIDPDEILFVIPVTPKAASSGLLASAGEQAYIAFAVLIGASAGPIQASSRTLLARLSPQDKTTEFFGFFTFSGKITSFAAPLAIGAVTAISDSQRLGISVSLIFLICGLLLLLRVRAPR